MAIVDGNQMFARPGPRLVDALQFLVGLLHSKPHLIPADFPWTWWDTQKAAALAGSKPQSQSPDTNGIAGSGAATEGSQMPHSSSSDTAEVKSQLANLSSSSSNSTADDSKQLPNGSSSRGAVASKGTTSNGITSPVGPNPHDISDPSSKFTAAEQAGSASQSSSSKAVEQSGRAVRSGVEGGGQAGQGAGGRKWGAAPFLGAEIEEAHAAAIDAGQPTYTDPATGYKVQGSYLL